MTIKRLRDWVMNKEWAVVLAVAVGAVTALEGQLTFLPEGDARDLIMGAVVVVGGFLTRLRVWSNRAVEVLDGVTK